MEPRQPAAVRSAPQLAPADPTAAKAASAWVQQFARTLKTCRLYDGGNPAVIRLREEVASALPQLLGEIGDLTLTITPDDILCEETSLYPARSREDNLALPFYRDGVRTLTLRQGVRPHDVETLLDLVLRVTGPHPADEDLVTLLWDSGLTHVDITYVSADGDVECGGEADEAVGDGAGIAPWPRPEPGAGPAAAGVPPAASDADGGAEEGSTRSDDRLTGSEEGDPESGFARLEARADEHRARFRDAYETDRGVTLVAAALDLLRDALAAAAGPAEREAFAPFLLGVLREAVADALWAEARIALTLLRECGSREQVDALLGELGPADSPVTRGAVTGVDGQDARGVEAFLEFACLLGAPGAGWLMQVLAASQKQRVRRLLTKVIAELCRERPESLAPWLADHRWYVVRNTVHTLGWIGGPRIVPLLAAVSAHDEYRVRREVVAALSQAGPAAARPLLLALLDTADPRIFCAALRQLAAGPDPELAGRLAAALQEERFAERPAEEQRAVYCALAAVGGDDTVPVLAAELHKGGRFARGLEGHRLAMARCLSRLDTPAARQALEDGRRSRHPAVRKVCAEVDGGRRAA